MAYPEIWAFQKDIWKKRVFRDWLNEDRLVYTFLRKGPALLDRKTEFEQMSLFT